MRSKEKGFEIRFGQDTPATAAAIENYVIPVPAILAALSSRLGPRLVQACCWVEWHKRKGLEASTCPFSRNTTSLLMASPCT